MNRDRWTAVDRYLADLFLPPDPALDAALAESAAAGLPAINVSAGQGRFLKLLAEIQGARSILEIGTLGGYSTIWLARALPAGGRLISLEADLKHATVARRNLARAGLLDVVDVRLGPALETLPELEAEGHGPFDFIFIDADKPAYADYFRWALRLARKGTVIVVDNVIRDGAVADSDTGDERVKGVQQFNGAAAADPRVSVTTIQTVGEKGYDGFALVRVIADPRSGAA